MKRILLFSLLLIPLGIFLFFFARSFRNAALPKSTSEVPASALSPSRGIDTSPRQSAEDTALQISQSADLDRLVSELPRETLEQQSADLDTLSTTAGGPSVVPLPQQSADLDTKVSPGNAPTPLNE